MDFLAVDNFDFTRKIVKKNLGEKLVKVLGFCQNWIFGQKFDFSNSVEWNANYKIRYIKSIKEKHGMAIAVCMIAIIVLQEHRIAMVYAQWCNMHEWSYI